jgi:hypothetical protein
VAIVAAVVDVVRAVKPCEKLQQKARLVGTAPAEVPEGLLRGQAFELADNPGQCILPGDHPVILRTRFQHDRLCEPAAGFQIVRRELLQLGNGVRGPEIRLDRPLHVGSHRLERLLAELRPTAGLIDHTPFLAPHAERTGLARILRPHGLEHLPQAANLAGFLQRVPDGAPTAAAFDFGHGKEILKELRERQSFIVTCERARCRGDCGP